MDLNQIKELISSNKERIIVVENGKPVVVLLSFEDYKELATGSKEEKPSLARATEGKKRIKKEENLKGDLRIEDLPF